ncbi:hypothetical protein TSUD_81300 [Trifolium subterraneum]|uniref:Pectinesterase inhibitor domain-containing protein n=1 Tax=Trifolium subterraneum TaxID=3900 RepID=A0A2Z6NAA2_TRISU|nr:hypothetical protein TSUD_81300 [Trifolium subterraneum]
MGYTFNKTLIVILSLSSLLLSSNAVPSTRAIDVISTSVPAAAPKSSFIDFTSKSFQAKAPSTETPSSVDFISTKVNPEILKICTEGGHKTKHCIETLSKLSKGPFDVIKTLEVKVNATLDIAKTLFDTIVKLRHDPSTDKRAIKPLNLCSRFGSSSSTSLAVVEVGFYSGSVSVLVSSNGGCRFGASIVVIHSPFAVASRNFRYEALLL